MSPEPTKFQLLQLCLESKHLKVHLFTRLDWIFYVPGAVYVTAQIDLETITNELIEPQMSCADVELLCRIETLWCMCLCWLPSWFATCCWRRPRSVEYILVTLQISGRILFLTCWILIVDCVGAAQSLLYDRTSTCYYMLLLRGLFICSPPLDSPRWANISSSSPNHYMLALLCFLRSLWVGFTLNSLESMTFCKINFTDWGS